MSLEMQSKRGGHKSEINKNPTRKGFGSRVSKTGQNIRAKDAKTMRHISHLTVKCPICKTIADFITQWRQKQMQWPEDRTQWPNQGYPEDESRGLGNWQGFVDRRHCDCCQMIVKHMRYARPDLIIFESTCPLKIVPFSDRFWIGSDTINDPHRYEVLFDDHPYIDLVPSKDLGSKFSYYIPVDPVVINLATLNTWPSYCNKNHPGSCHHFPRGQVTSPASSVVLIDIQKDCLVQMGELTSAYVALSYVWGNIPEVLESRIENFNQLCLPGSLKKAENMTRIPRTVLDAMAVSSAMGIRYLWVDRLCIVQDDSAHFTKQLRQMASIFANSYFTIIAVDGPDANYGLPGVCVNSPRSQSFDQKYFEFSAEVTVMEKVKEESLFFDKLPWHKRAWTFQERVLSPRTLVFTNNTVYWACRSAIWHERLAGEPNGCLYDRKRTSSETWHPFTFKVHAWPDMEQYIDLVKGYNHRDLTFESDAQNAFNAITTTLSASFPGGFLFGIPIFLFDIGLLWSRVSLMKRRYGFPSWSWLGWSGRVDLALGYNDAWEPLCHFESSPIVSEVHPLIDWYATYRDGHSVYTIDNSYHRYKSAPQQPDFPLPDGWSPVTLVYDTEEEEDGFEYAAFPEHTFKFPFPVSSTSEFSLDFSPPFLKIRTQSCTLRLSDFYTDDSYVSDSRCLIIKLEDNTGRWAGVVESLFSSENEYVRGTYCDFIAISCGQAERNEYLPHQGFLEMKIVDDARTLKSYEFYNVLWIETIDGVAYRKALGRVLKDVWEQQATKDVDVLLG